jgi:sorbitol-specific phosphotransferase system component IIC
MSDTSTSYNDAHQWIVPLLEEAQSFLTDKAKQALNNRALATHKYAVSVDGTHVLTHQCVYLGVRVRIKNLKLGIKALAKVINGLAEDDHIDSCLTQFSRFDLHRYDLSAAIETVVFCYPLVDLKTYDQIMQNKKAYHAFEMGEVPSELIISKS